MFVSGTLGLSGGSIGAKYDGYDGEDNKPEKKEFKFSIAPEFGYFVADKMLIKLGLEYGYNSAGTSKENIFIVSPAFHYYLKITDKFHYTPGISLGIGGGVKKREFGENENKKLPMFNIGFQLHLVAFEFRATENFAINLSAGEFGYMYTQAKEKEIGVAGFNNNVNLDLNLGAKVGFSYYF